MAETAPRSLPEVIESSGLIEPGTSGVVLCSGGADSAALAAGLAGAVGAQRVVALHLNYGLRADSDLDEATCRELTDRLGVELVIERPELAGGNVQAAAREARYTAGERLRSARGLDWIATGHTRTDLAETVLYRLASSPGHRALLGLRARQGVVVRPLLALSRERVRELARQARLPFRDDPSNDEPIYARNRIRNEVLPVLRDVGADPEGAIAETQAELAEEAEVLDRLTDEALAGAGAESTGAIGVEELAALAPAIRRLALRRLAERTAGRPVALGRSRAEEIWRLAGRPEGE